MMQFRPAPPFRPAGYVINPASVESLGMVIRPWGISVASTAYPAANLALYVPFCIGAPMNIKAVYWGNGTTAGGNIDVGIYNEDATKIVSLGSTARGTASSTITTTSLADTIIGAGRYYMAFLLDSTANMQAFAPAAGLCESMGILEQAVGAATLPSPATFAVTTRAYIPSFGLYAQTVAL